MTQGRQNKPQRHGVQKRQVSSQMDIESEKLEAIRHELMMFSGPLPPAEMLDEYERIYPGAAKIIFDWVAEESAYRRNEMMKDAEHRRDMERQDALRSFLGLACGIIIVLAGIGATVWLGLTGHEATASLLGITDIGAVAAVFVYGTSVNRGRLRFKSIDKLAKREE